MEWIPLEDSRKIKRWMGRHVDLSLLAPPSISLPPLFPSSPTPPIFSPSHLPPPSIPQCISQNPERIAGPPAHAHGWMPAGPRVRRSSSEPGISPSGCSALSPGPAQWRGRCSLGLRFSGCKAQLLLAETREKRAPTLSMLLSPLSVFLPQGACGNMRGFVPAGRDASGLPGPSPFILKLLLSVNDFLWLGVHLKGTVELPGGSTTCDTTADGGQKCLRGPGSLVLSQTLSLRCCVRPLSSVIILLRLVAKLGLRGSRAAHFLPRQPTDTAQVPLPTQERVGRLPDHQRVMGLVTITDRLAKDWLQIEELPVQRSCVATRRTIRGSSSLC
ncbi:uncharacterized protein LOC141575964 isoform X1 [Camelus bactrianus]|uniref:Uncharacterized protein LOC141575964 isoform X1 n=1 Tax=Camelus bactrianus TaxID=9837 RepID=A0AC58PVJ6_CAMBA